MRAKHRQLDIEVKRSAVSQASSNNDERDGIRAARLAALAKFGRDPLPINPETGKRWINTGRSPGNGKYSPIIRHSDTAPITFDGRFRNRRERAVEMRERMQQFAEIYNAGWALRDAYFGPDQRRERAMMKFLATMLDALRTTDDYEALIYAIADTVTASKHGVPWEE